MTPQPIAVGDPVRMTTRLRPPPQMTLRLDGIVESIDGDRAWIRWADGARSSSRLQFLTVLPEWFVGHLTKLADRVDAIRELRRIQNAPGVILAMTTADTNRVPTETLEAPDDPDQPRRGFMSGWAHLVVDGQAGPDDDRPRMDPSELED